MKRSTPLQRRTPLRSKPSTKPRKPAGSAWGDPAWLCRACGVALAHQHHVVYRQHVVLAGGDVWDPLNALSLCLDCHGHAHGHRRLPLKCLRDENFTFAAALLGKPAAYEYLRRRYSGPDPRLEALLPHFSASGLYLPGASR